MGSSSASLQSEPMLRVAVYFVLPIACLGQLLRVDTNEVDNLADHLPSPLFKNLQESGIDKCLTKHRKSPINVNLANVTLASYPPLMMENYESREQVVESEKSNITATIHGYDKWKKRPTLSGGPLTGQYKLLEVHWEMLDLYLNLYAANGLHYGHTINHAKYDFELHFVHTLNGMPLEKAKLLPNGVVIIASFVNEVMATQQQYATAISENQNVIPNKTMTPFEWVPPGIFFPDETNLYFTYNGTFSHPPCDGSVTWILMANAIPLNKIEVMKYLHAANKKGHGLAMMSIGTNMVKGTESKVFFNFPTKKVPQAVPLIQTNTGHCEVLGGIAAALGAVLVAVIVMSIVYRYFQKKEKTPDVNFNVGFDNVNFLNQNA